MIKFIERLFIKRRVKQFKFMNKHCDLMGLYSVINLWTGKFYHTIHEYELMDYAEIWEKEHIKFIKRDCLIMIK